MIKGGVFNGLKWTINFRLLSHSRLWLDWFLQGLNLLIVDSKSGSGSVIWDHSDHSTSNELWMNYFQKWICQFFDVLRSEWFRTMDHYVKRAHSSRNHYTVTFVFQDVSFVDTLVNLAGVIIECLDFSIPGLFALATTAAGKSPNTTPTKWTRRFQKPMGNFTSLVHLIAKLLSACKRTSTCKVCIGMNPEWSRIGQKWQMDRSWRKLWIKCNLRALKGQVSRGSRGMFPWKNFEICTS